MAKKSHNIRKKGSIYLSIDDMDAPQKGVKVKAVATIFEDPRIVMAKLIY